MRVKSCLPMCVAVLLVQGATAAAAETPLVSLPDPIAPAVIGRPLDQIGPVRKPARPPAAKRPAPTRGAIRQAQGQPFAAPPRQGPGSKSAAGQGAASRNAAGQGAATKSAAGRGASPKSATGQGATGKSAAGASGVPPRAVLGGPGLPPGARPGLAQQPAPAQRQAKQAVDDRADPRMRLDDVGKGIHFARKPLGPGAYFDSKDRAAVRKYYAQQPGAARGANWQIGEPVPAGAAVTPVPTPLRAALPKLPPGHRYVQVGGEVLLIASESRMVVDGISRSP